MTKRSKSHPIKGAVGGLFLGLGLSLLLLIFSIWVVKDFTPYYILIGACVVVGILWGLFGPARRRKRSAAGPATGTAPPAAPAAPTAPIASTPAPPVAETPAATPPAPDEPGAPG